MNCPINLLVSQVNKRLIPEDMPKLSKPTIFRPLDVARLTVVLFLMQRVQRRLAILNKRTKGGCSCACLLSSVVAIVILAVIVWSLIKYL